MHQPISRVNQKFQLTIQVDYTLADLKTYDIARRQSDVNCQCKAGPTGPPGEKGKNGDLDQEETLVTEDLEEY